MSKLTDEQRMKAAAVVNSLAYKEEKLRWDVEKIKLEVAKRKRELVPISEVRSSLYDIFKVLHTALTIEFPRSVAPILSGMTDPRQIAEYLKSEILKSLQEVKETPILKEVIEDDE